MNVDDAMETAKAYLVAREQMQEPLFESEEVAVTLAREVERLQVLKTRWKDDGDTWRRACRRVELELEKTHTEVERLRAEIEILAVEVTRLQAIEHEQIETQAELAAAKAASGWPAGWTEIRTNPGGNVVIYTENHDTAYRLIAWLRDRMKDASPPAT